MEQTRPPVVTILGHVDHGKTTLLDYIRKSKVASSEHGGITQAIAAYQIRVEGVGSREQLITFIDTPGHAAFEKMRARGAALADIAVLVVAADDGVMPQTVEAIKHIKTSAIPMIVAVNKIDLPGINLNAQLERIKKQLSDNEVLIEEYGGDTPIVKVSAKTGDGVTDLLETISLVAEVNELVGDSQAKLSAVVIESRLDKFRGVSATLLIRNGTLKIGDLLLTSTTKGKVRGLFDFMGKPIDQAGPSMPVEVLGFENVPEVGTILGQEMVEATPTSSRGGGLIDKLKEVDTNVLSLVVRADKQGSLEAITSSLEKLNEEGEKHLKLILAGTGDITESDVDTAAATKAIVIGFNVGVRPTAARMATTAHVLIRTYNVIYELLDEMKEVVEGMLKPQILEEVFGRAQIIAEFPYGKLERIAGCKMLEGTISKGPKIRIVRNDEIIAQGRIKSLKRNKEDVTKVEAGQECAMMFDSGYEFAVGDIVESYRTI